jgi:hypothetical protein
VRLLAAPPNSSIPVGARPLLALSVEGVSPPRRALAIVHHDAGRRGPIWEASLRSS